MQAAEYLIRPARLDEAVLLPGLEVEAARLFAQFGLPEVAGLEPHPVDFYRDCATAGSLWIPVPARHPDGPPLGFAAAAVRDGEAWLAELDVVPAHGRRGLGRRLLETVIAWAAAEGLPAVVLTSFRDIPFNGRFYDRMGFKSFEPGPDHPFLAQVRHAERARGLDLTAPRIAMRLDLAAGRSDPAAPRDGSDP